MAKEIVEEGDEEGDGWMWLQTIRSCENIIGDGFSTPLNQEKQIKEREWLENEVVVSLVNEEVMDDVTGDFRSFDILASRACRLGVCEKCS